MSFMACGRSSRVSGSLLQSNELLFFTPNMSGSSVLGCALRHVPELVLSLYRVQEHREH